MKTHKTVELAIAQTGGSKSCIVVSSLAEARFYAENGFSYILYGVPLGVDKIPILAHLNSTHPEASIHAMVDNSDIIDKLKQYHGNKVSEFTCFLKLDCDNGRAGVWYDSAQSVEFAKSLAATTNLQGIYAHCGNTYGNNGDIKVAKSIAVTTAKRALAFRQNAGLSSVPVGIGSTPSCSLADVSDPEVAILKELDEFHPGNYVLYDVMQQFIGSNSRDEIAGKFLCRVITKQPEMQRVIVDAGFTAVSKQGVGTSQYNSLHPIVGHPDIEIKAFCQEHGTLVGAGIAGLQVGDMLEILPYHSCVASTLHSFYYAHRKGKIESILVPVRNWF